MNNDGLFNLHKAIQQNANLTKIYTDYRPIHRVVSPYYKSGFNAYLYTYLCIEIATAFLYNYLSIKIATDGYTFSDND